MEADRQAKPAGENRLPMNLDYGPLQPWVGVFTFAGRNKDFCGFRKEQVTRPAAIFIARRGKHMGMQRAEKAHMSDAALQALGNVTEESKDSPSNKKKKKISKKGSQEEVDPPKRFKTSGDKWEKADAHPKKWGEHFVSTDDGTAICFRYAKGKGGECGEPCKEGR